MFDGSRIAHLDFRPDGTQIGREAYEGDPGPYREWQRTALAHAVPFEEYVLGATLDPALPAIQGYDVTHPTPHGE